jgi:hypothetical protein
MSVLDLKWDYEISKPMDGGAYYIRFKADSNNVIRQLRLEDWGFDQTIVLVIYYRDGSMLLQCAEGTNPNNLEVKATALLNIKPDTRPWWLNAEHLRKIIEKQSFLTAWTFIMEDLESMLVHAFLG